MTPGNGWHGYAVVEDGHQNDLNQLEAEQVKTNGVHPEIARRQAYQKYRRQQHSLAAAHHITQAGRAQQIGDKKTAEQHRLFYGMHLRQLGARPGPVVPAEVRAHLAEANTKAQVSGFQGHGADSFVHERI